MSDKISAWFSWLWYYDVSYDCKIPVEFLNGSFSSNCIDFWLNRYQTALTALLAGAIAVLAVIQARRQVRLLENDQKSRFIKDYKARISEMSDLIKSLSELVDHLNSLKLKELSTLNSVEDFDKTVLQLRHEGELLSSKIDQLRAFGSVNAHNSEGLIIARLMERNHIDIDQLQTCLRCEGAESFRDETVNNALPDDHGQQPLYYLQHNITFDRANPMRHYAGQLQDAVNEAIRAVGLIKGEVTSIIRELI